MARKLRVEYPGAIYHVMSRGNRREVIFRDDADRRRFVRTLADACGKTDWQVHAFVLMPNHFHLVLETPQPNLVAGMKWLLGTYTGRFNRRHGLIGHLFAGRYKSLVVDGSGTGYLRTVCDYVHLNPARAGLLEADQPLVSYPWSSWPLYLAPSVRRPPWLRVDRLLGEHGVQRDVPAERQELERRLETRRANEAGEDYAPIRRGWCLGGEAFRKRLLDRLEEASTRQERPGEIRAETSRQKAERIVTEELERLGWGPEDLVKLPKRAPEKVAIARRLRRETTQPVAWIAEALGMGSRNYVNHLLSKASREEAE